MELSSKGFQVRLTASTSGVNRDVAVPNIAEKGKAPAKRVVVLFSKASFFHTGYFIVFTLDPEVFGRIYALNVVVWFDLCLDSPPIGDDEDPRDSDFDEGNIGIRCFTTAKCMLLECLLCYFSFISF